MLRPGLDIASPPYIDVLHDQLDHLLQFHGAAANHPWEGCTDCARLVQIEKWLMVPFSRG